MRVNFKKVIIVLLNLLLILNLFGCAKELDISRRGIVTAVGLDKAENGYIELTLEIVNPSGLGVTEGGPSANIEPIWMSSTKGKTIYEATKNQLKSVSRIPVYNHVQVLVIGEELAKEGIRDMLDFFSRYNEARLIPKVIIAKDTTAKKIVSAKSIMETIPAMHLKDILENNKQSGFVPDLTIFQVLKGLSDDILDVTIGAAEFREGGKELIKDIVVEHTAVFNKDKFVGWLDTFETTGLAYIKDEMNIMEIGIKDPIDEKNRLVIEQRHSSGKIHVEFEDGKPKAYINIKADGIIVEQFGETDLMTEERIREVEKEVENTIKKNIRTVVDKAQNEFNSDILGIGDIIHKRHLKHWRHIKEDWKETFPSMPIEINVEFQVKDTGLTGSPYKLR